VEGVIMAVMFSFELRNEFFRDRVMVAYALYEKQWLQERIQETLQPILPLTDEFNFGKPIVWPDQVLVYEPGVDPDISHLVGER